jgi:hypothetical protein
MIKLPGPLLSDISEGRFLPFIGAGFSLNANLPAIFRMPDWASLASILAKDAGTKEDQPPPVVAERYEQKFGRVQLIEAIRKALQLDKAKPGKSHLAFVDLPFDTIYTTNFDLLLEDAYLDRRRPFRSLVGELQMPFHGGQVTTNIIKMHGDLRHEEHLIVTKRDYEQFMEKYPVVATHLSAMLITRTPLFIGYDLSDHDFQQIRKIVRSRLGRFERMAYVIQFDRSNEEIEKALNDNIHIISLETTPEQSKDQALTLLFQQSLKELDIKTGTNFRTSRPDIFEEVAEEVVEKAVQSDNFAPLLASTSNLCFVMMPFRHELDQIYYTMIKPAVEQFGLTVIRADEIASVGAIMEQIRSAIQQSRICIADISDANPNVLYEVGIAHTMGKPTVLLSKDIAGLPFDITSQRIIKYGQDLSDLSRARRHLEEAIKRVLEEDRFEEAERLIAAGHYRAAIAIIGIIFEHALRTLIMKYAAGQPQKMGAGSMLNILEKLNVIDDKDRGRLSEVVISRNHAVHEITEPTASDAQFVLATVREFVEKYI